jgi:hypothetical protein
MPSSRLACGNGGLDFFRFFAAPEQPILAGMRIDAAYAHARLPNTRPLQGSHHARNGPLHQARLNFLNRIDQSNVCRHMNHAHLRRAQHHRNFACTGQFRE